MRVVLARRRDAVVCNGETPEVHAYRVPDDNGAPVVWVAPCGDRIKPDEAELVEPFTGVPCSACGVIAALASTVENVPELPAAPDAELVDDSGLFAISWRERVVHRVGGDAARAELDGRSLVMGLCGFLGWGPVVSVPEGWPVCESCQANGWES